MLPVQVPGKYSSTSAWGTQPRQQSRHLAGIFHEVGKTFSQEFFLSPNDGQINGEEHRNQPCADPPVSRGDSEAHGQDEGTEIERVASISVKSCSRELFIFLQLAGCQRANRKPGNDERRTDEHGCGCRFREPQIERSDSEAQRDTDAARESCPAQASHGFSLAVAVPLQLLRQK